MAREGVNLLSTELLGKVQTEMVSREKQARKDLRVELERRMAAEGYKMADLFPEFGIASSSSARRKRPAKYRDPQNPDLAWSGIGRTPKGSVAKFGLSR